jgi:Glyoxalase/Bleomycin resistance protein/Dioxygenase superfamily
VEIALVAEDVDAADRIAVDAGCKPLAAPTDKPKGQRVGYVRDPFGMLVELARRSAGGEPTLETAVSSDRMRRRPNLIPGPPP